MSRDASAAWAGLEEPWRACFLLAWEAFQAGSVPVGAVLVDAAGAIVARGRNRRAERAEAAGLLAGSNIAHAEVNALAALPPGRYPDHVLYTTLEPCLLCTAAARYSHVGTVRFAAPDPMWYGVDRVPRLNEHLARWWPVRQGPIGGPLQAWAGVLHLLSVVERRADSVVDCYAETLPGPLALARRLAGPPADRLRAMSLPRALDLVWDELA